MFTGIIADVGELVESRLDGDLRARISTGLDLSRVDLGASIACDGICLTVVDKGQGADGKSWFDVDISAETIARTTIGQQEWITGHRLNLERALRVGDELGGHIVSGHVDGVAVIEKISDEGASTRVLFRAPDTLARFIAPKGSVALNGTSLTVNEVDGAIFGVNLIPHTKQVTTWGQMSEGDPVNLEIDTLARYVARLQEWCG